MKKVNEIKKIIDNDYTAGIITSILYEENKMLIHERKPDSKVQLYLDLFK